MPKAKLALRDHRALQRVPIESRVCRAIRQAIAIVGCALGVLAWQSACAQTQSTATADTVTDLDSVTGLDIDMQPWLGDLDGMVRRRVLRVLVPYSKTFYFVDLGGTQRGISYDFMYAFEQALNAKLKLKTLRLQVVMIPTTRDQLLPELLAGRGDVVAANLTITPERSAQVDFTIPLANSVREVLVTSRTVPPLHSLDDLSGKEIIVHRATSYYQSLLALNGQLAKRGLPPVKLRDAPNQFETEDILEMANAGLTQYVVADDYLARLWQAIYPNLRIHNDLVLRESGDIGFAVRKNSPGLLAELNAFARTHRQGTLFGNVTLQKYLLQTKWIKPATSPRELQRFNTLVELFQKYGDRYRLDWLLMAAQGYQESQLDQTRRSHVGAVGIMQVLPSTGAQMHVGDIDKLEPNIHAGVKYVRHLIDEYFDDDRIDPINKVYFALAAYNAGPTRVNALRREAERKQLDPNVWFDNVERVAAYRVGQETVRYVSNIFKYYFTYTQVRDNVRRDLNKRSDGQVIATH